MLNFVGLGFPVGSTSGTFDHTFTLATDLIGITPSAFITNLNAGLAYANIHDANFPGGEIRGQLEQVPPAVPEPTTLSLSVFGVVALVAAKRRKPRASAPS